MKSKLENITGKVIQVVPESQFVFSFARSRSDVHQVGFAPTCPNQQQQHRKHIRAKLKLKNPK
jgi:hypothetical protein